MSKLVSQSNAPAAKPAAPAAPAGPPLWQGVVVVVLLGLAAGYFAGSFLFPPREVEGPKAQEQLEQKARSEGPASAPDLRKVDELIEETRYSQALDACRSSADPKASPPPALEYRRALALEGLGRAAEAMPAYRAGIAGGGEHLRLAAQLGLARTHLQRGMRNEGRELLCALLARSAKAAMSGRPYAADAACLLALSLADELQPPESPSATRPATLAPSAPPPTPERYVGWDGPSPSAPRPPATVAATGVLTVARSKGPNVGPRVEASLGVTPVAEVLDRLARAAGVPLKWAPGAKDALLGRTTELACASAELADVVLWLTLPYGLLVENEKGAWHLTPAAKASPARSLANRREVALRALRDALLASVSHPLSGNLYLALGNQEAAAGRAAEAAGWYRRLTRERPNSPAGVPAMYNLGLLLMGQGDLPGAREAFFQAIDRAPGHSMTALCYWWIGRTHLDAGDTTGAQRPLIRAAQAAPRAALPRASDPPRPADDAAAATAAAAALALACGHLIDGEPGLARDAINAQQLAAQRAPFREVAALLDGLARYLLVDEARKRSAIQAELLALLLDDRDVPWLGPALPLACGKALGQMGLVGEMTRLYDRQLKTLRGPLAEQMQFEAGEALARGGLDKAARARLEPLVTGKSKQWAARATLRLAALDLQAGQPDLCLSRCRSIIDNRSVERTAVLSLMSRAYTSKRDYERAAACLAGTVPAP